MRPGAELKLPPLPLAGGVAVLMWLAARPGVAGWAVLPGQRAVAAASILLGAASVVLGFLAFRRARTTVNPLRPDNASSLVVSGVYRLTRNPMYVGFLLGLLGWALLLSDALALAGVPAFFLYIDRFQIEPEERALVVAFGPAFAAYQSRVRRWL